MIRIKDRGFGINSKITILFPHLDCKLIMSYSSNDKILFQIDGISCLIVTNEIT